MQNKSPDAHEQMLARHAAFGASKTQPRLASVILLEYSPEESSCRDILGGIRVNI